MTNMIRWNPLKSLSGIDRFPDFDDLLRGNFPRHWAAADVAPESFDVIVNASPMGMQADDPLPVDVSRVPATTFVGDVVTKPPLTPFIEAARARGCRTVTGTQMFARVCDRMVAFLLDTAACARACGRGACAVRGAPRRIQSNRFFPACTATRRAAPPCMPASSQQSGDNP